MGLTKHYNKIPFRELKDESLEATGTGGFLTKPCPLMEDGFWAKSEITIVVGDSVSDITVTSAHTNPSIIVGSTYTSASGLSLTLEQNYMFGECRCSMDCNVSENVTTMQGATSWGIILESGQIHQRYYGFSGAISTFKWATNSTNVVTFYYYVIPRKHVLGD